MKKTFLTVLFVMTVVCLFAFGASAYENDYFSIDVPAGYTQEASENGLTIEKSDEIMIIIDCSESVEINFGDLTSSEKTEYEDIIKDSFTNESAGISVEDLVSEFEGYEDGSSAMIYGFEYAYAGEILYYVEGMMVYESGILHHIAIMVDDTAHFEEAYDILDTYTPKSLSGSDEPSVEKAPVKFTSKNGTVSLELPADFSEISAMGIIEKQWMTSDSTFSVAYATIENTDKEALAGITSAELKAYSDEFTASAGDSFKNTAPSIVTVNGYEGIKITGDLLITGVTAYATIYIFATEDEVHCVYFYDYSGSNGALEREVINSLAIYDEILVKPTEIIQSTEPSEDADETDDADSSEKDKEEKEDDEQDKEDKGGIDMNIVIIAVAAVAIIAILAIVILKKKN